MKYHKQPLVYLVDATSPIYTKFDELTQLVIVNLQGKVLFYQAFKHNYEPWYVLPAVAALVNSPNLLPFSHYFKPVQALFSSATALISFCNNDLGEPFLYDQGIALPKVPRIDVKDDFCTLTGYPPEITSIFVSTP